ncbi:MAG: hypothetical protein JSR77_00635 [Planctomycetes bacterium]|nr:hypothetical protein [Planctomycetota bacterium]
MIHMLAAALNDPDAWLRVAARLHPVVVHFPIALLLTAAGVELWRIARRGVTPATTALTCCGLAVPAAAAAAVAGWLHADLESHAKTLGPAMELHRWVAIGASVAALIAWWLGLIARTPANLRARRWWVFVLFVSAGGMGASGHLGGSMVWGDGYILKPLFGAAPAKEAVPRPMRLAPAGTILTVRYADQISPIFERRCVECHNASKLKGGLRLDLLAAAFDVEQDLWAILPGDPDGSELVARIAPDAGNKERMPPKGERLTAEEISLIRTWIQEGAWEGTEGQTPPAESPSTSPSPRAATPQGPDEVRATAAWSEAEQAAIAAVRAAGGRAEPVALGDERLDINLSVGAPTDETLAAMHAVEGRIAQLNLAGSRVSESAVLGLISNCVALRVLDVSRTSCGDATAAAAAKLPVLERANFFGCSLTDEGLRGLARLKWIGVAATGVTPAAADQLRAKGVRVETGSER